MSPSVFAKAVRDRLRLVVVAGVSLGALTILIVPIYTAMASELEALGAAYPRELMIALGVQDIASPIGFLDAELFSLIFPIVIIGIGIAIGVAAIAGEEDAQTINILLAHPVTRTSVAWAKVGAMVVLLALIALGIFVALVIADAIGDLGIGVAGMAAGSVMTALLGILFGSLAFAVGAVTGRPGLSVGVTATVGLLAWMLDAFAPLVEGLRDYQRASPVYWYTGFNPLANGIDPLYALLMIGFAAALVVVGVLVFDRRDLAA